MTKNSHEVTVAERDLNLKLGMKKLINHKLLGGDAVDRNPYKTKVPQRKPEKSMSAEQMLVKAFEKKGKKS